MASLAPAAASEASQLLASKTGKLTAKIVTTTRFKTAAGTIECAGLSLRSGAVGALSLTSVKLGIQYEKCKAFGLAATIDETEVLVSFFFPFIWHYERTVTVLTAVGCTVTMPSAKNQSLQTVKFANTGKEVEVQPNLTQLTSVGVGAACAYAEESKGTYSGNFLLGLPGGTLSWDA